MTRFALPAAIALTALASCGEEETAVDRALATGELGITLAEYRTGSDEARAAYVMRLVEARARPVEDHPTYVACLGGYAWSKSPDLAAPDVFGWCEADAENDREAFEASFDELAAEDLTFHASDMCKRYVTTQLVAPATADFGGWRREAMGRHRYLAQGHVDAQNAMGAQVRTRFMCEMRYDGPAGEDRFDDAYFDYRNWDMLAFETF
jgi:hypothetical protein